MFRYLQWGLLRVFLVWEMGNSIEAYWRVIITNKMLRITVPPSLFVYDCRQLYDRHSELSCVRHARPAVGYYWFDDFILEMYQIT